MNTNMNTTSSAPLSKFHPPIHGALNPSTDTATIVTTPGSFANAPDIGGPRTFSSPDTPGMPAPSTKTAWDFLPTGWSLVDLGPASPSDLTTTSCSGSTYPG